MSPTKKNSIYFLPLIYVAMICLGIYSGMATGSWLQATGLLISELFIKAFKCISLPIIALSIIVTLASYQAEGTMQKVWRLTILYTIGTTIVAAAISCLIYFMIHPANVNVLTDHFSQSTLSAQSYYQHILNLVPSNIFSPFLEHQVMGVLFVGILIGIAIRHLPDPETKNTITHFFKGIHGIFLVITRWIVTIIPIGLFGFITATVMQFHTKMNVKAIAEYLLVVVLANLVQGFIILPLWLRFNKIKPFTMMKQMLPALTVAFFSKSSAGTLPITMDTAETNAKINHKVSRFVLPLCTSINMNGCAAFIFATVIYLMQNHGIEITFGTMILWIFIATIAAIGNAGVPMGCFFLSASLLASMNVPITLLGVIMPFYSVIDMIETALNVWSDSCVAKVVNEKTFMGS